MTVAVILSSTNRKPWNNDGEFPTHVKNVNKPNIHRFITTSSFSTALELLKGIVIRVDVWP